jgi:MFS family permease
MYDFANSGFTTVVITALFNAYFVTVVAGNTPWATFAWTASLSVSYVLIVLSGPLLGAYADRHAAKKRLLLITTAGCVLFTALLWFARPELLWYSVACVIAANFFFGSGENLIAAFLPELAQPRTLGRVSGWGWSLGYLGGLLTLGLCLAYVTWAEARGHGAAEFVPVTMLITAGIFALASLPTFLLLKERAVPRPADAIPCSAPLAEAWREVGHTHLKTSVGGGKSRSCFDRLSTNGIFSAHPTGELPFALSSPRSGRVEGLSGHQQRFPGSTAPAGADRLHRGRHRRRAGRARVSSRPTTRSTCWRRWEWQCCSSSSASSSTCNISAISAR